jgi:ribosome-binding protein aMBF1 (putative translation factor)
MEQRKHHHSTASAAATPLDADNNAAMENVNPMETNSVGSEESPFRKKVKEIVNDYKLIIKEKQEKLNDSNSLKAFLGLQPDKERLQHRESDITAIEQALALNDDTQLAQTVERLSNPVNIKNKTGMFGNSSFYTDLWKAYKAYQQESQRVSQIIQNIDWNAFHTQIAQTFNTEGTSFSTKSQNIMDQITADFKLNLRQSIFANIISPEQKQASTVNSNPRFFSTKTNAKHLPLDPNWERDAEHKMKI